MSNLLYQHNEDVDNLIKFLQSYKDSINNIQNPNNNTLISILLLNNFMEDLKDKALDVINNIGQNNDVKPYLKKQLDEYNENINNMKKLMPFLTLFYVNNPNLFQEGL